MAKPKINFEDEQVRLNYRHTTSHILAQAVKKLWPEAKLAIGPAIENGFYYDFDLDYKFTDQDLLKIQKEMKKIIQANYPGTFRTAKSRSNRKDEVHGRRLQSRVD